MVDAGDEADIGGVLVDRLAAALVHHEPGWRLPRPTALARRYDVRPAEIERAIRELAARHLVRQLPDGQLYRASPAELQIPIHGVQRLAAYVDPMGGEVVCRSRRISWRRVPEEIGLALDIPPADVACAIRCTWTVNGEPAASSTTYLTKQVGALLSEAADLVPGTPVRPRPQSLTTPHAASPRAVPQARRPDAGERVRVLPLPGSPETAGLAGQAVPLGVAAALNIELQPPPPAVARGLRLTAGQPAASVTVRYDDPATGRPVALAIATLRPDMFRIVIESTGNAALPEVIAQ